MKLTVKIKHLVLFATVTAAVFILLLQFISPRTEIEAAQQQFDNGAAGSKERLLRLIDTTASGKQKWELIRKNIIETGSETAATGYDIYVGPNSTMMIGDQPNKQSLSLSDKLSYLEDYLQNGPSDGYLVRAARQLAVYYQTEGLPDQAAAVLDDGIKRMKEAYQSYEKNELLLQKASIYASFEQYDKAEEIFKQLGDRLGANDWDMNGRVARERAQLLISRDGIEHALIYVDSEIAAYRKSWNAAKAGKPDQESGTPAALEHLTGLKANLEYFRNRSGGRLATVSGTIMRNDGTPLAGVGVFLRDESSANRSVSEGDPYGTITDAHGHYEFRNVLPQDYQLNLGLSFDQIDGWTWPVNYDDWLEVEQGGKVIRDVTMHPLLELISPVNQQVVSGQSVSFQWEKVEGAAYYALNGQLQTRNGTIGTQLVSHIPDNRIELTLNKLYDHKFGISYTDHNNWETVDPVTLLGFANTDNRFSWSVDAYDKNGQILTRSNGYRLNTDTLGNLPFFYMKERRMTTPDTLLMKGRLSEALALYKRAWSDNAGDVHSLRMIIRLLDAQALLSRDQTGEELPYLLRMMELNPSESYAYSILDAYYTQDDWNSYTDFRARYAHLLADQFSSYTQSVYGIVLMKQGKLDEAREELRQGLLKDDSHRFVGIYLAIELAAGSSFDNVIQLAAQYPERSFGELKHPDWRLLTEEMKNEKETLPSDVYMKDVQEKLSWFIANEQEKLRSWIASTGSSPMKAFIQALLEVN
ncbi:hypothetical protein [Paenibacillus nasutitermitis]|uniref:Carboxypeptidase regulatory-like domain-containing protein n=1 Tax=Paenibacillus nasutitermitis TaxID=1652958 RepID=A0A916YLP7_9BACL|nr:hypothetical protein [Paenibacillus nasutitermitis]GGD51465.1 hypothetical protein GCM10010911_06260 [Paenibacillus nasutitermitis]